MTQTAAWRVELSLLPQWRDAEGERWARESRFVVPDRRLRIKTLQGFCFRGPQDPGEIRRLAHEVLADPVLHRVAIFEAHDTPEPQGEGTRVDVVKLPGVMDPVAGSVERAARAIGVAVKQVRTYRGYSIDGVESESEASEIAGRLLANDVIEEVIVQSERPILPSDEPTDREWQPRSVALEGLEDEHLDRISREMALALTTLEMRAIREHYRELDRAPTDLELETLAQTWSEHCKHKTLTGEVQFGDRRIDGVLQKTVFEATKRLDLDWCLSVFKDNAGVIAFDDEYGLSFKVETHNHPSAIEPYGGAGTGIGGVLRDTLGTGLGALPILSTDVFCVGPMDLPPDRLPKGALHPRRVLFGVISGVRDYGNRMGIPTASGAVFFDRRYIGNPLVFCGNVGLIPRDKVEKKASPGDLVVTLGGRTGRDGIHGATFSSLELHEESETVSSGAVQIGNPIEEKKVMDVLLAARDRGLFSAVTDCGAGGFSSAVGEMGEDIGVEVDLEHVPLKYHGLDYTEIWISEAQERMVLAVPPEHRDALLELCESEDVEATVIGTFNDSGRLVVRFHGQEVGNLDMEFLHHGLPREPRQAEWTPPPRVDANLDGLPSIQELILGLLSMPNIASKEWIIRQYDHEVQAGSALKPLVGPHGDGPGDAAVVVPRLGHRKAFAVSQGMNPCYGDLDPYAMALLGVDEAVRNVVSVGARPDRIALLDNFAWGNCDKPDRLGSLVRAAEGCRDAALAYRLPFISGKDSLNNEFRTSEETITIPPSLLISSIGILDDVASTLSMDLKKAGSHLVLVGGTANELGGSHLLRSLDRQGGDVPTVDLEAAKAAHHAVHAAQKSGAVLSCHDLSEGGLGVAVAEMAMAGRIGASVKVDAVPTKEPLDDAVALFSESAPRYLLEVDAQGLASIEQALANVPHAVIGQTHEKATLDIHGKGGELASIPIDALETAFKSWPWNRELDNEKVSDE